jgi:hypothetical protein
MTGISAGQQEGHRLVGLRQFAETGWPFLPASCPILLPGTVSRQLTMLPKGDYSVNR